MSFMTQNALTESRCHKAVFPLWCQDGFLQTFARKFHKYLIIFQKTITTAADGAQTVTRKCRNDCVEGTVTAFGITTETHCCTGDICNNSPIIWAPYVLLLLTIFISMHVFG